MTEIVCKYCQSNNTRKYGKYRETQLYFCDDCEAGPPTTTL